MPLCHAQDVADLFDLPKKRIYELSRLGIIPSVRIGRLLRFDPETIQRWIAEGGQGFEAGWRQRSDENRSPDHSPGETGTEIESRT